MKACTLVITIVSVMDLKAHDDVYLVISLSGHQKQRSPVHKKGSTNPPWSGHPFIFTVDHAAVLAGCLKFKIKKAKRIFRVKRGVGEVDVRVSDLLGKGGASDVKPKVMSLEVKSSPDKTIAVLNFSYQQLTIEAPPADETLTGNPAAAAPPASNSAPSYPPPVPSAAPPPPADEPVRGNPAAAAPPVSNSAASYPPLVPGAAPPPSADESVTGNPAAAAPSAPNSAASYPPIAPGEAPPPSTDKPVAGYPAAAEPPLPNSAPSHPPPAPEAAPPPAFNSVASYPPLVPMAAPPPSMPVTGYPAAAASPAAYPPPPPWAAHHIQPAHLANAVAEYGYGAHAHPPAGHGDPPPRPDAGGNFWQRVAADVVGETFSNMLESINNFGPDLFPMPGFE